ncbi:MAG: MFS transporter [Methyloligellaceae bacterium]
MKKTADTSPSWKELTAPVYLAPVALVCLGIWLHASDEFIVGTLMPSIIKDIGGEKYLAWSLALYEIGSIISGALGALLSLRFGLRRPMSIAAIVFSLGCLASAIAPDIRVVLLGRLLQGLGGGALIAMSYISVTLFFPPRLSALVFGALNALWGIAACTGPLIGGLFAQYDAWRMGFLFFGLQGLMLAVWIFTVITDPKQDNTDTEHKHVPVRRLLVLSAGIIFIAQAGIDNSAIRQILLVLSGLTCLFLFFWLDTRAGDNRLFPKFPLSLANPIGAALLAVLLLSAATVAFSIYGPLIMIMLYKISALTAGYVLACMAIGWAITSISLANSPQHRDTKLILSGAIVITLSTPGLFYAVPNGPLPLIAAFAFMQGSGFGLAWTFIIRKAAAIAPDGETERVASAIPTMQRIGYATGAAFLGIIANMSGLKVDADSGTTGFVAAMIFLACIPVAIAGTYAMIRFLKLSDQ